MPKVNVYLPDDLYEAVKDAKVSLSPVCQRALQREVAMCTPVGDNPTAVADRLWQTKLDEDEERYARGYATGASWAREVATYRELERMERYGRDSDFVFELDEAHSLVGFELRKSADEELRPQDFTRYDAARPYDQGVVAGALAVWNQVAGLLRSRQLDEDAAGSRGERPDLRGHHRR